MTDMLLVFRTLAGKESAARVTRALHPHETPEAGA